MPSTAYLHHRDALLKLATLSSYVRVGLFIILLVCLCFSSVMWLHTISGNQCEITHNKRQLYLFFQNYQRCGSDWYGLWLQPPSHLFQGAFHIDALVPRSSGVGQAVAGVPPPRNVHLLPSQVPEGLGHHHHAVVRQSRGVLGHSGEGGGGGGGGVSGVSGEKPKPSVGGSFTCCYDFL